VFQPDVETTQNWQLLTKLEKVEGSIAFIFPAKIDFLILYCALHLGRSTQYLGYIVYLPCIAAVGLLLLTVP